jgi:hypothetical protein
MAIHPRKVYTKYGRGLNRGRDPIQIVPVRRGRALAGTVPCFPKALLKGLSLGGERDTVAGRDTMVIGAVWEMIDPGVAIPPNLRGESGACDIGSGGRGATSGRSLALTGPVIPGGDGSGVLPEATARRASLSFHTIEALTLRWRQLQFVGSVEPRHAGLHLREIEGEPIAADEGEEPVIAVRLLPRDPDWLSADQPREMAAGDLTVWLSQFGGVDSRQSNPVLAAALVDNGEGISVTHPGDPGHHRSRLVPGTSRGQSGV